MSRKDPQDPQDPPASPDPEAVPEAVPDQSPGPLSVADAHADLAANPGRDAVLSTDGWVVR